MTTSAAERTLVAGLIVVGLLLPAAPLLALSGHVPSSERTSSSLSGAAAAWSQTQLRLAQQSLPAGVGAPAASIFSHIVPAASAVPRFSWANISVEASPGPSSRYTTMTWDAADGYVLLYGGMHIAGSTYTVLHDTWTYLNGTWHDITGTVTGSPPPLAAATMAYDPADHEVLMFGGAHTNGTALLDTTWAYHAGTWTNLTGTAGAPPSPRIAASMVFDSTDGNVVLYGGLNHTSIPQQDTWTFHAGSWTNITASAPTNARLFAPRVADDPADHGILLNGIDSYNPTYNAPYRPATFLFTGGTWHNLTPLLAQEPPMVYLGGLVNLGPSAGIILFTGLLVNGSGYFAKGAVEWQYLGGAWTNITGTLGANPGALELPGWAATPDGAVVVFGGVPFGSSPNASAFTWVFSSVPTVGVTVSSSAIDVGQSVTASSSVTGGVDPLSFAWTFGDGGSATTQSAAHSYASAGLFLASTTITDLVGHLETGSAAVQVNPDPAVRIVVAPSSVHSGTSATFVAVVSGGTPPFTYSWTLGDGTSASTALVNHTYSNTGTVSVTVQVTDAAGQSAPSTTSVSVGGATSAVSLTSGTGLGLLLGVIVLAVAAIAFAVLWLRARGPRPPPSPPPAAAGGP